MKTKEQIESRIIKFKSSLDNIQRSIDIDMATNTGTCLEIPQFKDRMDYIIGYVNGLTDCLNSGYTKKELRIKIKQFDKTGRLNMGFLHGYMWVYNDKSDLFKFKNYDELPEELQKVLFKYHDHAGGVAFQNDAEIVYREKDVIKIINKVKQFYNDKPYLNENQNRQNV